jgi:hypothetical protein
MEMPKRLIDCLNENKMQYEIWRSSFSERSVTFRSVAQRGQISA